MFCRVVSECFLYKWVSHSVVSTFLVVSLSAGVMVNSCHLMVPVKQLQPLNLLHLRSLKQWALIGHVMSAHESLFRHPHEKGIESSNQRKITAAFIFTQQTWVESFPFLSILSYRIQIFLRNVEDRFTNHESKVNIVALYKFNGDKLSVRPWTRQLCNLKI